MRNKFDVSFRAMDRGGDDPVPSQAKALTEEANVLTHALSYLRVDDDAFSQKFCSSFELGLY